MGGGMGGGMDGGMGGFGNFDDMTEAERNFMMGGERNSGGFGGGMGGGMMGSLGGLGNAAMQGRKLLIEGLTDVITDQMVSRYFQKFGELVDWSREKTGEG